MRISRITKTIAAVCASIACLGVGSAVIEADAAPNGNLVVFGDSYSSNPDEQRNTLKGIKHPEIQHFVWGTYPNRDGCLQAPNNWPRQLQGMTGIPVADYSCTAESSHVIPDGVDRAIRNGDIHPGTRAVVFAVGINDYGPYGIARGAQPFNQNKMRADFVNNIVNATNKVRAVAPNAKILLPGMLSVTEPYGVQSLCFLNMIPDLALGLPFPTLQHLENLNRDNQRAAAAAARITYIENKDPSAGHNTCVPADTRWVAGIVDTTNHNMSLHPTEAGSRFMAEQIIRHL